MPLPIPSPSESHDQFISRCMADEKTMNEFPDEAQRYAVCEAQYSRGEKINLSLYPEGLE